MYDAYGSRNATVVDPFGHRWLLHTPLEQLPATDQQGDVGYAWLTVPDPDRAAAFYAAVLGWNYAPGYGEGRQVVGQSFAMGIGRGEPGWHLSWGVDDVAAAVERVRAAGGTASDAEDRPYGTAADGTDDQGQAFALHQSGYGPRVPENGARQGDLSYLTLEVVDSARFREFYGAVLGLRFEHGTIEDGWAVPGIAPMTGVSGGHAVTAVVPMWKVDDVAAAVERVRAAGGTATDPERQPYGTTAEGTDDQGVRFYLGDA
jgi:predicted enzyme related to lactoylglutathione lyase